MKKAMGFGLLAVVLALALAACGGGSNSKTINFVKQGTTHPNAAGTAVIEKLGSGGFKTTISATGLNPSTAYILHYHLKGSASNDACASGGGIKNDIPGFTTDANGAGSTTYTNTTATTVADLGVYINIHLGSNLATVPLCADVSTTAF